MSVGYLTWRPCVPEPPCSASMPGDDADKGRRDDNNDNSGYNGNDDGEHTGTVVAVAHKTY